MHRLLGDDAREKNRKEGSVPAQDNNADRWRMRLGCPP